MPKKDYRLQSGVSKEQLLARGRLLEFCRTCSIPEEELLVSLGLYTYTRSSVLAGFLYISELFAPNSCLMGYINERV